MLRSLPFLLLLVSIAPVPIQLPTSQPANDTKITLRVRMLDSRSGKQIKDDPFFLLVDHITDRTNIFVPTYPETEAVLVPSTVSVISTSGSYGDDWPYVNCDVNSIVRGTEQWYAVSSIVNSGVVAANHCTNRRATASPGEFIFFVRKLTSAEKRQP